MGTVTTDPVRDAAQEFLQAYGEHLNHHCPKCTAAWAKLRDALEAPLPEIPTLKAKLPSGLDRLSR